MLLYPFSSGGGGLRFGFLGSMKSPSPFPSRGPQGPPPVAPCFLSEPYLGALPAGARAPAAARPCTPGPGRPGAPCSRRRRRRRRRLAGLQLRGPGGWERPGPAPRSPAPPSRPPFVPAPPNPGAPPGPPTARSGPPSARPGAGLPLPPSPGLPGSG